MHTETNDKETVEQRVNIMKPRNIMVTWHYIHNFLMTKHIHYFGTVLYIKDNQAEVDALINASLTNAVSVTKWR